MSTEAERIVILGGRGMLGTDLAGLCRQREIEFKVFDFPEFDITDPDQIEQAIGNAKIVVNCAAYTNVEKAESQADLAYKVNGDAVGSLGQIAAKVGAFVVHVSTDFVFDGESDRPYVETDLPNPINTYGKSKLKGERLLAQSGCRYCIMRVEWTYGRAGNNFVTKLIAAAKQGKTLKVVDDQIGSPTATTEAAKAILALAEIKAEGIFHFACSGFISRFGMAEFIFDKLKIPAELTSCKSSDYKTAAARPLNSCFNCDKISALLAESIRPWQKPLESFLRKS